MRGEKKMKRRRVVAFVDVQFCTKNKSTSDNLHGFAHMGTLYIPMQWEEALTGSSAAAAGAEWGSGVFFYWYPVLQVQGSSSFEADIETESERARGRREQYI